MATKKEKIIIIVGPTASGKSELAVDIAKKYSGEIVSADSRQVYKKLDIGTAKITEGEMEGVIHHLIDVVDVETVYTAADFKRDATRAIQTILGNGNIPIIAGGTFFYVDALLERVMPPAVPPNEALREVLEERSTSELFTELEKKDPRRASNIDKHNKRRLIRALEIVEAVGIVPAHTKNESPYNTLFIGITTPKETLRKKLRERGKTWLESGLIEEIRGLLYDGVSRERLAEIGFEYQIGLDYIDGKLSKEDFAEVFEQKNWQYAKRQLTWLKRDHSINWVSLSDRSEIDLLVTQFLLHD